MPSPLQDFPVCQPAASLQDLLKAGEVALAKPYNPSLIPGTRGMQERGNEHNLKVSEGWEQREGVGA